MLKALGSLVPALAHNRRRGRGPNPMRRSEKGGRRLVTVLFAKGVNSTLKFIGNFCRPPKSSPAQVAFDREEEASDLANGWYLCFSGKGARYARAIDGRRRGEAAGIPGDSEWTAMGAGSAT